MAMRRRAKILLAVCLVPILLIAGMVVLDQFGPSIEIEKQIKRGMTRAELEQLLGPPSIVEDYTYEKQTLGWDLKDGTVDLILDRRHGRVIVETVNGTPGVGTATSGRSLEDLQKLPRAASREEAEQLLGKPTREGEWDRYTNWRLGWEFKDGFVFVFLHRDGRVGSVKASQVTQWERFWWRTKTAIAKMFK